MTPAELVWRVGSRIRDESDRYRLKWGLYPQLPAGLSVSPREDAGSRLCPVPLAAWRIGMPSGLPEAWKTRLVMRADSIAAHRFTFFDLENIDVGDPIDWNRDHASGIEAPKGFSASIDYRDARRAGDAKVVWEPNRHHHLVVLARAYRATGEERYAAAIFEQLESWLAQCPFGYGMNWRSPLELAVRLINWVWALDLVADYRSMPPEFEPRLLSAIHLHVWDIARKYSQGSSANNHLIGEACGVFVATSYFTQLPGAADLRKASKAILEREIEVQTYPGGATREQAFGYHLFVIQFFLYAGLIAKRAKDDFSAAYWQRLERMFEFAGALTEGGPPPSFGDADDGYVLDLGDSPRDVTALMTVGRLLFPGSTLAGAAGHAESAYWIFGSEALRAEVAASGQATVGSLESKAFPDAGLYLLQWSGSARDRVSVLFDCGELGFTALAAHGHADALSFTLRAFGVEILVDPGTFDYFTYPEWRRYFRSTPAHNTVGIDGEDQSVLLGSFLWGTRANARCTDWKPRSGGGLVSGEHDGYTRLSDPVVCSRTLTLDQQTRTLRIVDRVSGKGRHKVVLYLHLSEFCAAEKRDGGEIHLDFGEGRAVLRPPAGMSIDLNKGGNPAQGGWVSRGYHRKVPAWTIAARADSDGAAEFTTVLELSEPRRG